MRCFTIAAVVAVSTVALTQIASAADLPRKAPAYIPLSPPILSWTGWYAGLNAGGMWSNQDVDTVSTSTLAAPGSIPPADQLPRQPGRRASPRIPAASSVVARSVTIGSSCRSGSRALRRTSRVLAEGTVPMRCPRRSSFQTAAATFGRRRPMYLAALTI